MSLETVVANLVQKMERRFYGKYRGFVVDNADPEQLGRLKLTVPSVLGDEVVTGWAMPCVPYGGDLNQGFLFIPEVGAGVWVEFEEGDLEFPIWVGTFWSKPGGESELPKPNKADGTEQDSVQNPPTRKIIRTLKGNSIEMEDKDNEEVFIIKYHDGSKTNLVTMDKDGIVIADANGNKVTMDQNGFAIEDKNENKIEMNASTINIFPAVECYLGSEDVKSANVNVVNNLPACLFTGAPHSTDAKGYSKVLK